LNPANRSVLTTQQPSDPAANCRHVPDTATRDHFHGCLLGAAVGDALGAPVEFMSRDKIIAQFGDGGIRDMVSAHGRIGAITDDTQMALFTAEGLLRAWVRQSSRGICHPPSVIANAYLRWLHTQGIDHPLHRHCLNGWLIQQKELFAQRAPGNTCLSALQAIKSAGDRASNKSKGCGGGNASSANRNDDGRTTPQRPDGEVLQPRL
jgi:ADP-ribosylglycohydrolase